MTPADNPERPPYVVGRGDDFIEACRRAYGDETARAIEEARARSMLLEDTAALVDDAGADLRAAFAAFDQLAEDDAT
jgi:hypothetical protein